MPNGGGTEYRVAATLTEAFVSSCELSSGRCLPRGGKVHLVASDTVHLGASGTTQYRLRFRVVSAAFEGLEDSERTSLLYEVLLDGAWSPFNIIAVPLT